MDTCLLHYLALSSHEVFLTASSHYFPTGRLLKGKGLRFIDGGGKRETYRQTMGAKMVYSKEQNARDRQAGRMKL